MAVFRIIYKPIPAEPAVDPDVHVVLEEVLLTQNSTLAINEDATLMITNAGSGSKLIVTENSVAEFN